MGEERLYYKETSLLLSSFLVIIIFRGSPRIPFFSYLRLTLIMIKDLRKVVMLNKDTRHLPQPNLTFFLYLIFYHTFARAILSLFCLIMFFTQWAGYLDVEEEYDISFYTLMRKFSDLVSSLWVSASFCSLSKNKLRVSLFNYLRIQSVRSSSIHTLVSSLLDSSIILYSHA